MNSHDSRLTSSDVETMAYFILERGDVTRWSQWEQKKDLVAEQFPAIIRALQEIKYQEAVLRAAIDAARISMESESKMTYAEHLAWAKKRALDYVEQGLCGQAFTSFVSDLNKHDELRGHAGIRLGAILLANNHLHSQREMREFIEGFN